MPSAAYFPFASISGDGECLSSFQILAVSSLRPGDGVLIAPPLQHWYPSRSRLQATIPIPQFPGFGSYLGAFARRRLVLLRSRSIQLTPATLISHRRSSMARQRGCPSSGISFMILQRRFINRPIRIGRPSCIRETQMGRYSGPISALHSPVIAASS